MYDYVGLEPESSDTESQAYIFNDYQPYSNGHDAADQHDLSHAKQPYQSKATHQSQPAHENNAAHLRCDPKFKNSRPASVDTEDLIFDCEA
ncbi:hypothetical protein QFC19_007761 [Naganishia cerealis]|uniref:Uncharacterized protein n=1 Tax=Naganishia cerealis TaxID=610337 RepID=A0ACC2V7M5_9TREE|nr:hypothetical protein QFC19_007761 [Naganishia cerealis]